MHLRAIVSWLTVGALLALTAGLAAASVVSQPIQLTDDIHYERGQAVVFDGTDYWLFYGRSATATGWYQDGDPDVYDYQIFYKKAASVADLATAAPIAVPGAVDCYNGEIGAAVHGGEVWTFAAVPSANFPGRRSLNGWYSVDGGTSWAQAADIADDLSDGAAHHDEISYGGELFVLVNRGLATGGWSYLKSATPAAGGWTPETPIAIPGNGLGHFMVDGADLYLGILTTIGTRTNRVLSYDPLGDAWSEIASGASTGWDPSLFMVGSQFVYAQAPWISDDGGYQHVIAWSAIDPANLFVAPSVNVTDGRYGTNTWTEMWPTGFVDDNGDTYLFYTSERDLPAQEGTGNIWCVEFDWDPAVEHHDWIQTAVDAAVPGETISIAEGVYTEQVHVTTSDIALVGAGVDRTVIASPVNLAASFPTGTNTNFPVVFIDGARGVDMSLLTVDGDHQGDTNYRFIGVAYWNSDGVVDDMEILNVMNSTFSGAQHGVGLYVNYDVASDYRMVVSDLLVDDFQKTAVVFYGAGTVLDVDRVTTLGEGATDVTAQNGIQVGPGMTGTLDDCVIRDIHWLGETWTASGMIIDGDVDLAGIALDNCQTSIYIIDTGASVDACTVTNPTCDALWVYSTGAKGIPGKDVPQVSRFDMGDTGAKAKAPCDVTITNSTFAGIGLADSWGVNAYASGPVTFTVTGCTVSDFTYGVVPYDDGGGITSTIHGNSITGCDLAIGTAGTTVQDASGNWYGTAVPAEVTALMDASVDYSPWLASGVDTDPGAPGFQGDLSTLWIEDDSPQAGATTRLQEAFGMVSGSTINIAGGTYVESGQFVVDHALDIVGDPLDKPVIMTDTDTGGSGDARGWWLVTATGTLNLQDVVLDGGGHQIYQGIRATGGGSLTRCDLRNMVYPTYSGLGLAAFGDFDWSITDCTFTNMGRLGMLLFGTGLTATTVSGCTYTGKGDGDWLDYFIDLGAGAQATITGCTVTGCTGVAESDGSTSAGIMVTTLYGDGSTGLITDCVVTGNSCGIAAGYDENDIAVVTAHGNDLSGNISSGIEASGPLTTVDATDNWWGSATGPYNETSNPLGTGVPVSDHVLFTPWDGLAATAILPATAGPIRCGESMTLAFHYTPDPETPALRGYEFTISVGPELTVGAIVDGGALSPLGQTWFNVQDNGDGTYTVADAILGTTSGLAAEADLFTIQISGAGSGAGLIEATSYTLRDLENHDFFSAFAGATINVDCDAPDPATAIAAAPGHDKVTVTWDEPATDVVNVEIWRGMWYDTADGSSAYPLYDDLATGMIPARPAIRDDLLPVDSGEWILAGTVAPGVGEFVDTGMTERGVYYYEVITVDEAGNFGAPAAANDRATSYWLGDVANPYDGLVDMADISKLGASYGLTSGYNLEVDVGPTDDWTGFGIPTTDGKVGFEDLMIFALNYSVVAPGAKDAPEATPLALAWAQVDETTWALQLVDPCAAFKGLQLRAMLPEGVSVETFAGALLDKQSNPTFLKNAAEGALDIGLAVLGNGCGFEGSGDLLRVTTSGPADLTGAAITARDTGNGEMEFGLSSEIRTLPAQSFRLDQNAPNPFNPMTKISFRLPETQTVRLTIIALDGRRVATLIDRTMDAGAHDVTWNGRDDIGRPVASGTYFYRVDAGPYSQTRKMTLVR